MKPVRWGVLGVSKHYHLRCSVPLARTPVVDVVAIASRSIHRAQAEAKQLNIAKAYGSYEELLADSDIEAVFIPLPNHMHLEWIKKAADAGKHILCEKPLCLNAGEVEAAMAHAEKAGVLLMEAFMYRFHPQWQQAKTIVSIGEIGQITAVQSNFFFFNQDPNNIRNKLEYGGGGIFDIGCYAVSSARFLTGLEPTRVVSLIERDKTLKIDKLTSAILDFNGIHATFSVGIQTSAHQGVQVFGTGGSLQITLPFNAYPDVPLHVTVNSVIGSRTINAGPADQYQLQFEAFSFAIREGRAAAPTPPSDALANQKVLDALFRSERSGSWQIV